MDFWPAIFAINFNVQSRGMSSVLADSRGGLIFISLAPGFRSEASMGDAS
jgi:hypothetical protein